MIFIGLNKIKKMGAEFFGWYWILGRCDSTSILKAQDEKTALRSAIEVADSAALGP